MKLSQIMSETLTATETQNLGKGDIALAPFPFTDQDKSKQRPCLVLARSGGNVLAAFMTTQTKQNGVKVSDDDFSWREFDTSEPSLVLPDKIATIDTHRINKLIGHLREPKRKEIISRINSIIS